MSGAQGTRVRGDFTSAVSLSLPDRGQAWVARKFDPFTSHKTATLPRSFALNFQEFFPF